MFIRCGVNQLGKWEKEEKNTGCALLLGGWPARGLPVVTAEDPEGTQKHVRPRKAESRHTIACIHTSPAQPP